ncbi:putative ribonuclease H-like domain-containing protein [Tanacetum coccineum]
MEEIIIGRKLVVPSSPTKNGSEKVGQHFVIKEIPSSYANKLSPTSLNNVNLQKLDANVPNDAYYDVWLHLESVHEFPSTEGVDSVLIDVWVKFHDAPLVAYTSDGLSLIATKIGTPMMLDSYTNSMCLESWGRSSYARILVEIDACNDFSDNLVMAVPNLEGT